MTLMRNPHFREWSRDAQPAGFPDRIVITDPGRPDVPLRLVRSGRADAMVGEIGPDVARQLGVRFPTRLHSVPDPSVVFAVLSNQRPPFDDARVRRAVNLAVDRRAAVAALGGPLFGRPLCQMIPPNVLGFRPTCSFTRGSAAGVWSAPDVDAARRLVAASRTRGTAVTVWTSVEEPLRGLADVLAATLRRLGYPTRVRVVPGSRFDYYGAAATPRNHAQIGPFRWGLDAPVPMDVFGPLLTCDGVNRVFFCDPAFDRRVEAAAGLTATDQKAAADRWAALDREVIERAVVAPLATQSHVEFVSARVGNFQDHPVWGPLYGQLWVR
jgi:peptide/nickel transport system substrate-binding protein